MDFKYLFMYRMEDTVYLFSDWTAFVETRILSRHLSGQLTCIWKNWIQLIKGLRKILVSDSHLPFAASEVCSSLIESRQMMNPSAIYFFLIIIWPLVYYMIDPSTVQSIKVFFFLPWKGYLSFLYQLHLIFCNNL